MSGGFFDLSRRRSVGQASGFYLVTLLGGISLSVAVTWIYLEVTHKNNLPVTQDTAAYVNNVMLIARPVVVPAVAAVAFILTLLVARAKKVSSMIAAGCLLLAAGLPFISGLLAFIPAACLTMLEKK